MNEPQVWTLIGVFAAAMFALVTLVSTMFIQTVRSEIRRLDARFDVVATRLDNLDRDVQALVKHTFGLDRG